MTVREALSEGASVLSGAGSDTPFLDVSLLLSRATGFSRGQILARGDDPLAEEARSAFFELLARRGRGESVAYILGYREFYGRTFIVNASVLVPRPDTEILVEAALDAAGRSGKRGTGLRLHDAFTGSGCVGVTLAAELPEADVSLSDRSEAALSVADANARSLLGRSLTQYISDVLASVAGPFDIITANPPYVTTPETDRIEASAAPDVREPRSALDGGADGLFFYRRLVPEAEKTLVRGGGLVVEIGEDQGPRVAELFRSGGFRGVEVLPDLAGRDRVVRGVRA